MIPRVLLLCTLAMSFACSGNGGGKHGDALDEPTPPDQTPSDNVRFAPHEVREALDLPGLDAGERSSQEDVQPECGPGRACGFEPCAQNGDCQSGWCVEHLGDGVCTQTCEEECPLGWSCKAVGGGPDIVFVCVSGFANLCKPCWTTEGCKSVGAEDVCVSYGAEGSFCGGACEASADCPEGFGCRPAVTVEGVQTMQCTADAGVCPCSGKAVALSLTTPCQQTSEFGACAGKRQCKDDGLAACDAPVPAAEECDGVDNDCDSDTDEDTCDDDNDCTEDSCLGAQGCINQPLDAVECKDGDPCTAADHCEQGACVGDLVTCEDENACTDNLCTPTGGCEYVPVFGPCDDGDPCTAGDLCSDGACAGTPVSCDCKADADCLPLEDGDVCNGTLVCDTGMIPFQCVVFPGSAVKCPAPAGPDSPCLVAACDPAGGACSLQSAGDGAPCDDGDACTWGDQCAAGKCGAGKAVNCNDGNPCTDDTCAPATGCEHWFNSEACTDGNVCTQGDVCAAGSCQQGKPLVCDDGNVCNGAETCDPLTGCVPGEALACDDDDPCNGLETCDPLLGCKPGIGGSCDDGNPCTKDSCAAGGGCQHPPDNAALCDDGNACTTEDHCAAGACTGGSKLTCTDDNPCTDNSCDPAVGCLTLLNKAPCDDGNICTTGDHCGLGLCISSGKLTCDDKNPCTNDSCAPAAGCEFVANTTSCDDGNACTASDVCSAGWCGGTPVSCDDKNPCTDDMCDKLAGCTHAFNDAPCEDGNPCSANDKCSQGKCAPGGPASCDDGNPCTDDSCTGKGCTFVANKGACDDGDACTAGDFCSEAKCVAGAPVVCDDKNVCTDDSCDPTQGCKVLPNTAACSDGNLCTQADTCAEAKCVGGPPLGCDDGVACTQDKCEPLVGCVHIPSLCCGNGSIEPGENCDDGNTKNGDGCNSACQYESFVYSLPFSPDDFDVAYDGRLAAVGRENATVVAQCYRADRQPVGNKFTVMSAAAGTVIEHVHMGMAGLTGYWGVLVRHQTIPGDYGSRKFTFRLYDSQCQPVTAPTLISPDDVADEPRDMDVDEQGNAYLGWMGKDKKMYLAVVAPNGSYKVPPKQFDTCNFNFGMELAVQPNGSQGVVTCQGHAGDPIWFWLFDSNGIFTKSKIQVPGAPPSSWYISHEVGMNAAGQFVVVWAASSPSQFRASFFDAAGNNVAQAVLVGLTSGSCYDPYRESNTKIQSPGGDFVLPYVRPQDGSCSGAGHHGFHRFSPTGGSVKSGDSTYLMHTLAMDNFGSTYVRDGSQIRLNAVSVK